MEWKDCSSFPAYEISECGDMRRKETGKKINGFINQDGYIAYSCRTGGGEKRAATCHRLVALAFIGPPPSDKHEVAHNNGSRIMNHYSNLRWATRKENHRDTVLHGTQRFIGEKNNRAKLDDQKVRELRVEFFEIKNRIKKGKLGDLARKYDIHHSQMLRVVNGDFWGHVK